ncbi:hypothetical protein PFISCL1PPCAC_9580, partial [Pristionchus fissidentatus]
RTNTIMKTKDAKQRPEISMPSDFQQITHIDRSATVDELVNALQGRVTPVYSGCPDSVPLPRKASAGTYGRGTPTPTFKPMTPAISSPNIHHDTVSSGHGTWNTGRGKYIKRREKMSNNLFLVPQSQAPEAPGGRSPGARSPSIGQDGGGFPSPISAKHGRSVSTSNEGGSSIQRQHEHYVNVKEFGHARPEARDRRDTYDPHSHYTYAANDGYLASPYSVLKV